MVLDATVATARPAREPMLLGSEPSPVVPLSKLLWGVDWCALTPTAVGATGTVARASSFREALPFIRDHFPTIFEEGDDSPFRQTTGGAAKARYYDTQADFFELEDDGRTVALVIGAPTDWSTYYIRSAAVLPGHQGRGIAPGSVGWICEVLREVGVERVEADAAPSNYPSITALMRLGFNPTGSLLSERWGAHVRLTKFLHKDAESTFGRLFCGVARRRRQRSPAGT